MLLSRMQEAPGSVPNMAGNGGGDDDDDDRDDDLMAIARDAIKMQKRKWLCFGPAFQNSQGA